MKKIVFVALIFAVIFCLSTAVIAAPAVNEPMPEVTTGTENTENEPMLVQLAEEIENLRTTIKNIGDDTEDRANTITEALIAWMKKNAALIASALIFIANVVFRVRGKKENSDLKRKMQTVSKYLTQLFGGTTADGTKLEGKVYEVLEDMYGKVNSLKETQDATMQDLTTVLDAVKGALSDTTETVDHVKTSLEVNASQIKAQTEAIRLQAIASQNLISMTNAPDYQKEAFYREFEKQETVLKNAEAGDEKIET